MSKFNRHFKPIFSIGLILVFLFNAMGTFPAAAAPLALGQVGTITSVKSGQAFVDRLRAWLESLGMDAQTVTPNPSKSTETPTPGATPLTGPAETASPTETISATATLEPSPTFVTTNTETPTSSVTPPASPTVTEIPVKGTPTLSFDLSVSPEMAAPGDEVTFTVSITNKGDSAVTGLLFSNQLPQEFGISSSGFGDFNFDPRTRLLTWDGSSKAPKPVSTKPGQAGNTLQPGETLTLQYSVKVDASLADVQIKDAASLTADGWSDPLTAAALLTVVSVDKHMSMIGPKGGQAVGLGGRVKVEVPAGDLSSTDGISIQEMSQEASVSGNEPALYFSLDKYTATNAGGEGPVSTADVQIPLAKVEAQFDQPVKLTVSLDGVMDLNKLTADKTPMFITYDESTDTWARLPVEDIDKKANTVTAQIKHFSGWGVTFGNTFPQNGANVLLFDSGNPSLFTGSSKFSIPIWTPPGRNGMAPSLALSYSSATADGILGDIQAPWVGMGWSVDTVEITRKLDYWGCTGDCSNNPYRYQNKFALLFNGAGGELIPDVPGQTTGRYHTKSESFLDIERHNDGPNTTGEWWEIVTRDGTHWRLGWNENSEQTAAMDHYNSSLPGYYATLGYAGHGVNVVASRWRADQVTDTFGNTMTFSYSEEQNVVADNPHYYTYDRASYLTEVHYTGGGGLSPAYSVIFETEDRKTNGLWDEVPYGSDYDSWDTKRLQRIVVKYNGAIVRTYDLGYDVRNHTDSGTGWNASWDTTVLTTIAVTGMPTQETSAPTVSFDYQFYPNRFYCAGNGDYPCPNWAYPRLTTISNGWGGLATYTYENDENYYDKNGQLRHRLGDSWYNWRVNTFTVSDGVSPSPMKTTYVYENPCYDDIIPNGCDTDPDSQLQGYGKVTVNNKDFNDAVLAVTVHKFYTEVILDDHKVGMEYETQHKDTSGTILSQTNTTYTVVAHGISPTDYYYTYASAVDEYLWYGDTPPTLTKVNRTEYGYDSTTGNLTTEKQFIGTASTSYRKTDYLYALNLDPSKWILDKVRQKTVANDAGTVIFSQEQYGYDNQLPGVAPTKGALTLSRIIDVQHPTQTIDTGYAYDQYGNRTYTYVYGNLGSILYLPSGSNHSTHFVYDAGSATFVTSTTNALNQTPPTLTQYDYGLGLPTQVTDLNGNTTTTTYDGLGRTTAIKYPGYSQDTVKYTYPPAPDTPPSNGISALKMEVLNQTTAAPPYAYISSWEIFDGLGRVLQMQGPYQTAGKLVLTDTSYNAMGQVQNSGQARIQDSGTGGTYYPPTWGSVPHITTTYEALGRTASVTYPDNSQEITYYAGLVTSSRDRNNHATLQGSDAFGRSVMVAEYTGESPDFTLYTYTTYTYDARDLLTKVTDTAGNQTSITYDGFGRKIAMSDPDLGAGVHNWIYGYDVFGNLTSQTDARGCVTTVGYDVLNRPTYKTYSGPGACAGTLPVNYTYDSIADGNKGKGHRTGMDNGMYGISSTTWFYNSLGQVSSQTDTVDGTVYTSNTTPDAFGRPLTQILPNGESLTYVYNLMGLIYSLTGTNTYLSSVNYNEAGQVTDQKLGNNLIQQSCYDDTTHTQRLTSLRVYPNPGTLPICGSTPVNAFLNLNYSYQNNGNISQTVDSTRSETVNYTYDELDRLLSASGPYSQTYAYNEIGNLTSKSTVDAYTTVSAGIDHTCGLTATGGVKCWGYNNYGQLGDGTNTQNTTPVDVSAMTSGVNAIAVGGYHTCALTSIGGVKCWGYNGYGQLGDGTTTTRIAPVNVLVSVGGAPLSGVVAITAGTYTTCALITGGGVKCWGYNGHGELGDGTTTHHSSPVDVVVVFGGAALSGVSAVAAGMYHTCALTTTGGVKCWGNNGYGQLGDGTLNQHTTPVDVLVTPGGATITGMKAIAAGAYHSCAVTTTGGAKCWGYNNYGQLGDNSTTQRANPVNVKVGTSTDLSGVSSIAAGMYHTCALTTTAGVKCWGYNAYGQIGDNSITSRIMAVDSGLTSGVSTIAAGAYHTCARTTSGGIKCWGNNSYGQLGDGRITQRNTQADVSGLTSGVSLLSAGTYHTCALSSGGVKCWGSNNYGQVGDTTTIDRATPVNVSGLTSGVSAIAAGGYHTCALITSGGGVKCWGNNGYGQLGDGTLTSHPTPVVVTGLTGVLAITAGTYHTCALMTGGGVKCWGYNFYGQLGNNSNNASSTPVDVKVGATTNLSGVTAITAGIYHTCALMTGGGVKCWGYNAYGQVGDGTTANSIMAVNVVVTVGGAALSGVSAIAGGGYHTCALITTGGGVKCWGYNNFGQLGDGTVATRTTPVNVVVSVGGAALSGVSAITADFYHTCARTTGGGAKCWGYDAYGQLGDGTTTRSTIPVDVVVSVGGAAISGVSAISAGGNHTCALVTGGGAKCWGYNTFGQLGDNTPIYKMTPTSLSASNTTSTYNYNDSNHAHAVSSLSTDEAYTYDLNGNMTQRVEGGVTYNQTFDAENRLVSVAAGGQTTSFAYDGDGNMVKKTAPDNSYTLYIGGVYEVRKAAGGVLTGTTTYYPAGGAIRVTTVTPATNVVYYVLGDQLGSTSVVTDASGVVKGVQRYYPFGETRYSSGSLYTDKLYTGQQEIGGLGLYNYKARFYDDALGRFISADTVTPGGPQGLNRYSYATNNPVNYNDPSGHCPGPGGHDFPDGSPACNGGTTGGNPPTTPPDQSGGNESENLDGLLDNYSNMYVGIYGSYLGIKSLNAYQQLSFIVADGKLIIYGSRASRELLGMNPFTNRINLGNSNLFTPEVMIRNGIVNWGTVGSIVLSGVLDYGDYRTGELPNQQALAGALVFDTTSTIASGLAGGITAGAVAGAIAGSPFLGIGAVPGAIIGAVVGVSAGVGMQMSLNYNFRDRYIERVSSGWNWIR